MGAATMNIWEVRESSERKREEGVLGFRVNKIVIFGQVMRGEIDAEIKG